MRLSKYFCEKIGFLYEKFGFNSLEEFKNKIINKDKEALHSLLKICLSNNLPEDITREVIDECVSLNDVTALKLLADGCLGRRFDYEIDLTTAQKILKKLVDEFNDEESELELAFIYLRNEDLNKYSLGKEMINKIGNNNPCLAYTIAQRFIKYNEYKKAIQFYKLARIHIIEYGHDYYNQLDDNGVMYYVYPLIADAYDRLFEHEKANKYREKGLEQKIPGAIIHKAYGLMCSNHLEEAYEIFKEFEEEKIPIAFEELMNLYLNMNKKKRDEKRRMKLIKINKWEIDY